MSVGRCRGFANEQYFQSCVLCMDLKGAGICSGKCMCANLYQAQLFWSTFDIQKFKHPVHIWLVACSGPYSSQVSKIKAEWFATIFFQDISPVYLISKHNYGYYQSAPSLFSEGLKIWRQRRDKIQPCAHTGDPGWIYTPLPSPLLRA